MLHTLNISIFHIPPPSPSLSHINFSHNHLKISTPMHTHSHPSIPPISSPQQRTNQHIPSPSFKYIPIQDDAQLSCAIKALHRMYSIQEQRAAAHACIDGAMEMGNMARTDEWML
jgi:hypothetical protein